MRIPESLIGAIYEAGAFPELWPSTLEAIAKQVGALGGNLIVNTSSGMTIKSSPSVEEITREFDEQGWNRENSRVTRLMERASHPGFLTDRDLHSLQEIRSLPMYTDFLTPRGADAGAATVIQGANDDGIVLALEAFENHQSAKRAVKLLDRLRPHIARASVLSSRIQDSRFQSVVAAFNSVGTAIALLDKKGSVRAASNQFTSQMDSLLVDGPARLRICDVEADRRFAEALGRDEIGSSGASIALRNSSKAGIAVLHLVPALREARDLFGSTAFFAILAQPDNQLLPSLDILSALFDLTPAEARVARAMGEGLTPSAFAKQHDLSLETVRSQLKKVFAKTSTKRQGELGLLVSRLR